MKIIELMARRIDLDKIFVSWATYENRPDSVYTIKRAFNVDDFEIIAKTCGFTSFIDTDSRVRDYDLIVYQVSIGDDFSIVNVRSMGDKYLLSMVADNIWRLNHLPALDALAFCMIKKEDYCPECWSDTMKKRTKTSCSTCDGSGAINAFRGPVKIRVALIDIFPTREIIGNTERDTEYINCWTANYPDIDMNDYIYMNGRKYSVYSKPLNQEHQSLDGVMFLTMQRLQLKRMEESYMPNLNGFLRL